MAERPLILLPQATTAVRGDKGGGGDGPSALTPERQNQRLGQRLAQLERAFTDNAVRLQFEETGLIPEEVLVLETAGSVDEFVSAVRQVDGLEFLGEFDELDIQPDPDFYVAKKGKKTAPYSGRVYMLFSNREAFQELLRLWSVFQRGEVFDTGFAKWRHVFGLLRNIRPWGMEDRLVETGVLDDWRIRVEENAESVCCEIELWFRTNRNARENASGVVRARVAELKGEVLSESSLEGIRYHGLAVRLPIAAVEEILDEQTRDSVALVQSEQIQFFRASGQMVARVPSEKENTPLVFSGMLPSGPVRVALFDGLPLENHLSLAGRLRVDDPDGFATGYSANARAHGTSMASLIVWGDLNVENKVAIPAPLYVRPVLRPVFYPDWTKQEPHECMPEGTLAVDLVHRAVRRLFEPIGDLKPVAPEVALINFSIGIRDRPFLDSLSPLARMLDWLSWTHQVLFVVSAGNYMHDLEVGQPWSKVGAFDESALAALFMQSLAADSRNRRSLSPAEAMNVLTVGALHSDDDTTSHPQNRINPVPKEYPSPYSAHGLGYRRSVKPDLLMAGGRLQFFKPVSDSSTSLRPIGVAASPGHKVAAPGPGQADVSHTAKSRGTSNAAALLSRRGAFLANALSELRQGFNGDALAEVSDAVILKALLTHGASWGSVGAALRDQFGSTVKKKVLADQITRFLGFGGVDGRDLAACTSTRVTAVGGGKLAADTAAEHRFPLPPSLAGKRGWRRLTVTLAWFTPVNPLSHKWRQAHLWFEKPKSKLSVNRIGPDWQTGQRGTVQHDSFEGESASAFIEGDDVVLRVSCREDAPGLDAEVPYAIVVSLEVGESVGVDIYAEVSAQVRARVEARSRVRPTS